MQAGFDGDPAAKSKEEIIFSYPGFLALWGIVWHTSVSGGLPFIPGYDVYAHDHTGIDINQCWIGEYSLLTMELACSNR